MELELLDLFDVLVNSAESAFTVWVVMTVIHVVLGSAAGTSTLRMITHICGNKLCFETAIGEPGGSSEDAFTMPLPHAPQMRVIGIRMGAL